MSFSVTFPTLQVPTFDPQKIKNKIIIRVHQDRLAIPTWVVVAMAQIGPADEEQIVAGLQPVGIHRIRAVGAEVHLAGPGRLRQW